MRFPDRAPLEGIFENNVYKGNPGAKKKTRTPGQVIDLGEASFDFEEEKTKTSAKKPPRGISPLIAK